MIKNFFLTNIRFYFILISFSLLIISCKSNKFKVDLSDSEIVTNIHRFDQDLFVFDSINETQFHQLRLKYNAFFDLFNQRLNPFPAHGDTIGISKLNRFIKDKDIKFLKMVSDSVFQDFSIREKELNSFWKHYHYYFPDNPVPEIVTYISDFSYNIIALDSVMGIALNMYFGSEWEPYKSLQIEQYRVRKMQPDRIVFDVAKGWYESEYLESDVKSELISLMIYNGKLYYYMDAMFPDAGDYKKIGYTEEQFEWMKENESSIWAFFIENDLLYNTRLTEFMKFIHDGNSTSGFPNEAPAQMGSYIGWQIIRAYMNKNPEITLAELMQENDINKILSKANYKPKK